jgi:uncharacterized protein YPO0396
MLSRLEKYRNDLEKARIKRNEWDGKVKELERKCKEEENTTIHDMVHAANMTPEQLARLLKMATMQQVQGMGEPSPEKDDADMEETENE